MAKMVDLTDEQKLILINLIGERRHIVLDASKGTRQHMDDKRRGWIEIIQQCREDYNFNPVPGDDWQYLRDTVWYNTLRRTALRHKYGTKTPCLTEIDIQVLSIVEPTDEPIKRESDEPADDVDSNAFYNFEDDDASDVPIDNTPLRRSRTSYRSHPYDDCIAPVVRPLPSLKLANGSTATAPFVNGETSTHAQDQSNINDEYESRRNLQLQNQLLEAQVEFYKSQAGSFKNQAELYKNQAAYWKMKMAAMRMGMEKRNVVVRLEDDEDNNDG